MFVKVCGLTRAEDALACVDAGVDAIGLNFWPRSKRYVTVENAAAIARMVPASVTRVGVFVNAPADEIARLLDERVIDLAQLHGDEPPDFCSRFGDRFWKAIRLRDERSLAALDGYGGKLALVDADAPGYGGSGLKADFALARRAAEKRQVLLAGGLTPENVAEAISAVRPFGVDVAGGVESAPGIKDAAKIRAFVAAARAAAP